MAVRCHLGYYRTRNSAIRSSDPKNPNLQPHIEWIGCTICEIFAFKLYFGLETGLRGHSRPSKAALFDKAHTTLYSSSIVTMPLSITVSGILVENFYPPLYLAPPLGWGDALRFTQRPLVTKNYNNDGPIGQWKNFDDTFSHIDTIHASDRQTDGRNWRGIYAL